MISYKVFRIIEYQSNNSGDSYHHSLFVETDLNGHGYMMHVTGRPWNGMRAERKPAGPPDGWSLNVLERDHVGWIAEHKYPRMWLLISSIPTPRRQHLARPGYFDGPRDSGDWTAEAVRLLEYEGLMEKDKAWLAKEAEEGARIRMKNDEEEEGAEDYADVTARRQLARDMQVPREDSESEISEEE